MKPSGVYVRQGTTSVPASEDAIRRMIKEADGDSYEENRSLLQELSFAFAEKELSERNIPFGRTQQQNMGVMTSDGIYTNLGLLLSEQCRHTIKFAVFQGTDKLVFRDRKEIIGSIFQQMEEAYRTIDFYNAVKATFVGMERKDERDYPPEALREALFNAIVHREYAFSGSTLINLYSDRIEFISLGGLVSGLSLDAVMLGISQTRNEKLASLFFRMHLIEAYGTGIGKIMGSYAGFGRKPVFENVEGAFRVTLPNRHQTQADETLHMGITYASGAVQGPSSLQQAYEKISAYVVTHKVVSRKEVEDLLALGTTRTNTLLNEMIRLGQLTRVGTGKNTRYVLQGKNAL